MELDSPTIELLRQRDRGAQALFLKRYGGVLRSLVRRCVFGVDVDDSTQELLVKMLTTVHRFDPLGTATLSTWVFSVAHRFLIDRQRRRHLGLVPLEEAEQVPDESINPVVQVFNSQLVVQLEKALPLLPEAQRRVWLLIDVHEQSLQAVAEIEGVHVGTIKSRLHRARAQLAVELSDFAAQQKGGSDEQDRIHRTRLAKP